LDLVELEVRELLSECGFPGDEVPVVRVSALRALVGDPRWSQSNLDLVDAVDGYVPVPERELGQPFLVPIEGVHTISGRHRDRTARLSCCWAPEKPVIRAVERSCNRLFRGTPGGGRGLPSQAVVMRENHYLYSVS
jgi:translation elongation factor EF-Tu-like GTPase